MAKKSRNEFMRSYNGKIAGNGMLEDRYDEEELRDLERRLNKW